MSKVMNVWDVLKSPHITEKSMDLREATKDDDDGEILTFKVARNASKFDIKKAVEEIFGVKVDRVRTMKYKGKMKRQGRFEGRRAAWKKAYVTLKAGQPPVNYEEAI